MPEVDQHGHLFHGPIVLVQRTNRIFLVSARGCLMHKISASTKNGTPPQGWFLLSSQMKSQRFILVTKIKYTDSLYQIRINNSSFFFLLSKLGFFFEKGKKLLEHALGKKNPKISQVLCQKMAKFGQKKKTLVRIWNFVSWEFRSSLLLHMALVPRIEPFSVLMCRIGSREFWK